jgi:prepilin signal peptidase PulO-like enzyme (type II secretory pathway)
MQITELYVNVALSILFAGVGLYFTKRVAFWISLRSSMQPVSFSLEDEREFLHSIIRSPVLYPAVGELSPNEFAIGVYGQVWSELKDVMGDVALVEDISKWKELGGFLDIDLKDKIAARLLIRSIGVSGDVEDVEAYEGYKFVSTLAIEGPERANEQDVYSLLRKAEDIHDAYLDRTKFNGGSVITTAVGLYMGPLRRAIQPRVSRVRAVGVALMIFLGSAPFFASFYSFGYGWFFAMLAMLSLGFMSVVVSFVDQDTMYLDMPVFGYGVVTAWIFAILAGVTSGEASRLLAGLFVVVPLFIVFEVTNFLFQKVKGVAGMGFGDTLLLIGTSGIPAAISGSYLLGIHCLIAGLLSGIFVWVVKRVKGEITRESPFAFGPYLAIGWILGWLAGVIA